MKKLALLLAALSVASVSYAKEVVPEPVVEEVVVEEAVVAPVAVAPTLRVTSVGQYLEIDNTSGAEDIGEGVHLGNKVGLALGDNWTFDLMARKTWSADTDDGMKSNGHRIELGATRHFENFTVGMKWRGEKDNDRLYIPMSYNYGMVSGWVEPAYGFTNGSKSANDYYYLEAEPVQFTYGPVQLAYYFEGLKETGDDDNHEYSHQVRLRGTLYSNDALSLGAEYRYQFAHEVVEKGIDQYENNRHIGVLSAAYNVTENLVVDTYYEYDFNKYDAHDAAHKDDDYYGEFGLGWTYNF
ncbi:hypothetical protein [Paraclostridium bifermentans]|uniref:hypothetical protein n=1 Tax=Paraclostridium bifermentans TaxID=1490 RepID=UPI00242BE877|nr:hypothetical protein [Paraclostridium bifermentans]